MTKDDLIAEVAKVLVGEGRPLGRVDAEAVITAIRAGVESGTIKGAEVWLCEEHGRIGHRNACDGRARVEACPMVRTLVIPASDGGSET